MKILTALSLLFFVACEKKVEVNVNEIETKLFPLIEKQEVAGQLKCVPDFVIHREENLFVFCEPVDKTDTQMVEALRKSVSEISLNWVKEESLPIKNIKTRFTDEIVIENTK